MTGPPRGRCQVKTVLIVFADDFPAAGAEMLDRGTFVNAHLDAIGVFDDLDPAARLRGEERPPVASDRGQPSLAPLPVDRRVVAAAQVTEVPAPSLRPQPSQQEAERRVGREIEIRRTLRLGVGVGQIARGRCTHGDSVFMGLWTGCST
jgi:hypothetical protein